MSDAHRLPPDEHERIFQQIAAQYLGRCQPQRSPVAIITGGQPGAGKAGLTSEAKADLAGAGGYVLIDADKLRSWHPHYARLLREDDLTAANKTHPDAGAWASRLAREAVAGMRNVIFDQTSKDPAAVQALANRLHGASYTVQLRVMAVNERVSEQRIYTRYEAQKAATGHGRFSTKDNHDAAYAGVLATVAAIEAAKGVDALRVYDKDHRVLFQNALQAGSKAWVHPTGAAQAMEAERVRSLTLEERAELRAGYDRLVVMAAQRHASQAERDAIGSLRSRAEREHLAQVLREDRGARSSWANDPVLVNAYRLLKGVAEQAAAERLPPAIAGRVVQHAREQLAARIERGEVPAPTRDRPTDRDRGPER